ncbi:hypothetical protein AZE42_12789 [Rhizopogon vesiculosus]|uniref:Uncharacterized protein n=1 Tax=Rhizopogon vesiculosus TaxID=180088 RepID=A0A1J8Q1Q6_9AGAM|nr:hypothetical protein AZE42_12789 [Rhizopogon vesiculosus]
MPSASPSILRHTTPSPSPILALDSTTQLVASQYSQNWVRPVMVSAGAGANDVPPFAGIDNLDGDLASLSDASQKDNRNGINDSQMNASANGDAIANAYMTGHAAKCCHISTDRVSANSHSHI